MTRASPPSYDVAELRRLEFPWADRSIFLNHASVGPIPERTRLALDRYNRDRAAVYRLTEEHMSAVLGQARRVVAQLINAAPEEISLTTNTSYGIHLAAQMLPLRSSDIVLVSEGEFPANVYPWKNLEGRGVVVEMVPVTSAGWPDEDRIVDRMGDRRVRALAVSQVQFHTGYRADLRRLSDAARATGTFLAVDAIQAVGQVPLDVRDTPVDVLACGAQKWLLSPWGAGFTYVRRELVERLAPPLPGWTAYQGLEDYRTVTHYGTTLLPDARRFDLVTLPFQDFAGMNESVGLLLELGIGAIRDHLATIIGPVLEWARRRGVPVVSPVGERGTGIVALKPSDPGAMLETLTAGGVVAGVREGTVRLSPHCYNTIEEFERVAALLG